MSEGEKREPTGPESAARLRPKGSWMDPDPCENRPSYPLLDLLDLMQQNRVDLGTFVLRAGLHHGVDLEEVRRYVRESLETPLRMGWIRATHTDGTAERPYLTDDLTVEAVLDLAHNAIEAYEDPGFDRMDHDFWFAVTDLGREYFASQRSTTEGGS